MLNFLESIMKYLLWKHLLLLISILLPSRWWPYWSTWRTWWIREEYWGLCWAVWLLSWSGSYLEIITFFWLIWAWKHSVFVDAMMIWWSALLMLMLMLMLMFLMYSKTVFISSLAFRETNFLDPCYKYLLLIVSLNKWMLRLTKA